MKIYTFLLAFIFSALSLFSQKQEGYFTKDSVSNVGFNVTLFSGAENAKYCHIQYENAIKKYTPEEVDEYGVKGRVFVAKEIEYKNEKRKVFLERLSTGKIKLYLYVTDQDKLFYYTTKGHELTALPKKEGDKDYKQIVKNLTSDCQFMTDKLFRRVKYKRKPLSKAIKYYNICKPGYIPAIKTGIVASIGLHKNTLTESMKIETHSKNALAELSYPFKANVSFGAFIDIPINLTRHSFHFEALINHYDQEFSEDVTANYEYMTMMEADRVLELTTTTLQLPIMYKYTIPHKKNLIFVNGGPEISLLISDKSSLRHDFVNGETQEIDQELVDDFSIGISAGMGVEFDVTDRFKGFSSFRYTMTSINNSETFIQHIISLNFGIFI